jgi:hypothetical protein
MQNSGTSQVMWRQPGVVGVVFRGHASSDVVTSAVTGVAELLGDGAVRAALIDTGPLTGFDASVSSPGRKLLEVLVAHGAQIVASVAPSSAVRMLGSALSLATGARVRFFANEAEADAAIARALVKLG